MVQRTKTDWEVDSIVQADCVYACLEHLGGYENPHELIEQYLTSMNFYEDLTLIKYQEE